ncbi:HGxxPAAW family protein [Serinicoccus kebangsaanensis]|uniref:HGxxPAAW family protein n=1 Tax=Serinicoccus kebangsaanensis TaxID=2602069 RepID=UPI00124CD796|nr:HGxxPAAW family protein [Serinicoccus kebangsaanensis]
MGPRRLTALTVTVLGLGLALLATGQPWTRGTRVDAAGVAWEVVRTGHELAPAVSALLLVAAVAVLVGLRGSGWAPLAARLLALVAGVCAVVVTAGAAPADAAAWWWVCLVAVVVATLGALVLVPSTGEAGTMTRAGRAGPGSGHVEEHTVMHEDSHGHSVAAWVGVGIMLVGSVIGAWGVVFAPDWLLWVGVALGVVGGLAWYLLDRAGMGEPRHDAAAHH